jgi:hypothetical protein
LFFLSCSREITETALVCFEETITELQLQSKPSHEQNLLLSRNASIAEGFESASRLRHLGLEFLADGSVRPARAASGAARPGKKRPQRRHAITPMTNAPAMGTRTLYTPKWLPARDTIAVFQRPK